MKHYEFWFIVGSQTLYGDDVLTTVANRAEEMAQKLSAALTQLKTANEALRGEVEQERELERQRLAFFSAASHGLEFFYGQNRPKTIYFFYFPPLSPLFCCSKLFLKSRHNSLREECLRRVIHILHRVFHRFSALRLQVVLHFSTLLSTAPYPENPPGVPLRHRST